VRRALPLLLLLIGSLAACGDDENDVAVASTTTTTVATTTTASGGEVPATLFAVASDGVTERSASTGAIVRTVTPLPRTLEGPTWIEADRAHGRVFFGGESCDHVSEIWSVPINGGTPSKIASGDHVSVSPDGTKLAFARLEDGCAAGALVVRDLTSGDEIVWRVDGLVSEVLRTVWSADGTTLAYSGLDDARPRTYFLDPRDHAARLGAGPSVPGRVTDSVVVGDQWRLALLSPCPDTPDCDEPIVLVDGGTREIIDTMPRLALVEDARLDAHGTSPLVLHYVDNVMQLGVFIDRTLRPLGAAIDADW